MIGDISLSYGMKHAGAISAARSTELFAAVLNPWVALGIVLLLAFFGAYLSALSSSDLTYVLPPLRSVTFSPCSSWRPHFSDC